VPGPDKPEKIDLVCFQAGFRQLFWLKDLPCISAVELLFSKKLLAQRLERFSV
jgi:hypothetical protein